MKNGPYTLIIAPKNYPGKKYRDRYCYEHHYVYWKKYKRTVKKGEIIHHKNHDHRDNRISNLELITNKEHSALHGHKRHLKTRIGVSCGYCNVYFYKKGGDYRYGKKIGFKNFYCSKRCMINNFKKRTNGAQ